VFAGEEAVAASARRSPRAARALPAGHEIEPDDVVWLRPRDGGADDPTGQTTRTAKHFGDLLP
jgi:hypothetical protein